LRRGESPAFTLESALIYLLNPEKYRCDPKVFCDRLRNFHQDLSIAPRP
jgi:hypothetical protein